MFTSAIYMYRTFFFLVYKLVQYKVIMMTPEYEIILVQTAEHRQECYDVVNKYCHTCTSILVPIMFFIYSENSRLSLGAKVSSRNRNRWASYPISSTWSKLSKHSDTFSTVWRTRLLIFSWGWHHRSPRLVPFVFTRCPGLIITSLLVWRFSKIIESINLVKRLS